MTDITAPISATTPVAAAPADTKPSDDRVSWAIYRVMLLLAAISTLSFVDRFVINILAEDIKLDLHLSDTELGFVSGIAFAFFYALLVIPSARFADRTHRPRLLAAALIAWSGFTILCGMTANFVQLALARIGVGIGESSGAPVPQSLVGDLVPLSRRAWAMGYIAIGAPLGSMIGMGIGGVIVDHFGWRTTLLIVGLPGFILAALMLFVHEPRLVPKSAPADAKPMAFGSLFKLFASKRSMLWMLVASALANMVQMGRYAFVASFFLRVWKADLAGWGSYSERVFHIPLGPVSIIGLTLGIGGGLAAALGIVIGGRVADAWGSKDMGFLLRMPGWCQLLILPCGIGSVFAPSVETAFLLLMLANFFQGAHVPPLYAAQLGLSNSANRATLVSVFLVTQVLFGTGVGPVVVGALSDLFNVVGGKGSVDGIRYSFIVIYLFLIPAVLSLFAAARHYKKDFVA